MKYIKNEKSALLVFLILGLTFLIVSHSLVGDFGTFYKASSLLPQGIDIYATPITSGCFHYLYSPFFAILIYPLTFFDPDIAALIWKVLSLLMIARSLFLFSKIGGFDSIESQKKVYIYAASIIFTTYFSYEALRLGQMSPFILWAMVECLYQSKTKKVPILGSAILGLAINIKIMPITLLPYLLYRKHFKAFILVILFCMVYFILPEFILGSERHHQLLVSWWNLINPSNTDNIIDLKEHGFHSITSFISILFDETPKRIYSGELLRRHIYALNHETIGLIIRIAQASLILFTLYFLRTKPFKQAKSKLHEFWELSYICLITPLIFPHQQVYGFLIGLPAATYCIYILFYLKKNKLLNIMLIISFLLINLVIFLGLYKDYFWHYKTMTYGIILLLIILTILNPLKKLKEVS